MDGEQAIPGLAWEHGKASIKLESKGMKVVEMGFLD